MCRQYLDDLLSPSIITSVRCKKNPPTLVTDTLWPLFGLELYLFSPSIVALFPAPQRLSRLSAAIELARGKAEAQSAVRDLGPRSREEEVEAIALTASAKLFDGVGWRSQLIHSGIM